MVKTWLQCIDCNDWADSRYISDLLRREYIFQLYQNIQKNTEVYKIIKTAGKIYISTASLVWAEPHVFCHLLTERYGLATPRYCTSDSDKAHSAREIRTIPSFLSKFIHQIWICPIHIYCRWNIWDFCDFGKFCNIQLWDDIFT